MHYVRRLGHTAGEKLIRRLMRSMNLLAIYPKPRLSQKHPEHRIYPYLLRGVEIIRANQVWATDITYIQLARGFCYLVAIMDWFSRYVLAWRLSNTLDASFCVECLEEALRYGRPDIFNNDQGIQFTSINFTQKLLDAKIRISMDGRGRVFDNIFIERLWRTVKYGNIYVQEYPTMIDAHHGLGKYFNVYNTERLHQSLEYQTPWEVYSGIKFYPPTRESSLILPAWFSGVSQAGLHWDRRVERRLEGIFFKKFRNFYEKKQIGEAGILKNFSTLNSLNFGLDKGSISNLLRWIGKYMGREKPVENDYRDSISALNKYGKEDLIKEGVK